MMMKTQLWRVTRRCQVAAKLFNKHLRKVKAFNTLRVNPHCIANLDGFKVAYAPG
jgi:hypothetical protein